MPLEPTIPQVSLIHAKILFKKISKFMKDIIWFYAGDFNITPDSITYSYIKKIAGCIWKDYNKIKLTSPVYPITNYAYIRNFEFAGCIDYIFFSKYNLNGHNINKIECIDIYYSIINNIIPDINQPSDHISIYAKFKII